MVPLQGWNSDFVGQGVVGAIYECQRSLTRCLQPELAYWLWTYACSQGAMGWGFPLGISETHQETGGKGCF